MSFVATDAIVEEGATIGQNVSIWSGVMVRSGASLGANCIVGRNAYIDAGVSIGHSCKIQDGALLYAPARVGDGVFIGPGVILTNDRSPRAVTPDFVRKTASDWDPTAVVVGDGASLGAGVIVIAGVSIGRWALAAAGAVVTRTVPSFALVAGVPARQMGWVGMAGVSLEEDAEGALTCPLTHARYRRSPTGLEVDE